MPITFESVTDPKPTDFCALFVHEQFYISLLRLCNNKFNLHLLSPEQRELELRESAYMLISTEPQTIRKINAGTKATVKLVELVYHKHLKVLAAKVYLRKVKTSAKIPHIIIAKDPKVSNKMVYGVLDGSYDHMGDVYRQELYEPVIVKGKIGIMRDSTEEQHNSRLHRPTVAVPVRAPTPEQATSPPVRQVTPKRPPITILPPLITNPVPAPAAAPTSGAMTITLTGKSGKTGRGGPGKKAEYTEEDILGLDCIYQDDQGQLFYRNRKSQYLLEKGSNGGFYYINNKGKKQYFKAILDRLIKR